MSEGGEQPSTPESEINREALKSYLSKETDLPDELIGELLVSTPDNINISALKYKDNQRLPRRIEGIEDSLVLVHMTDHFPRNDRILTPYDVSLKEGGDLKDRYRLSIHTSLSCPVSSHSGGDWSESKYAALIPFELVKREIVVFEPEDTFTIGPIDLDNSVNIVSFSEDEIDKAIRVMMRNGCVDIATMKKLLMAASRQIHLGKVVEQTISGPDWQVNVERLVALLPDDHKYKELLSGIDNLKISRNLDSPIHYLVAREIIRMGRLPMFYKNERQEVESTFARLAGKQHSQHAWRSSGLALYLRTRYNKDEATTRSGGNRQRLHSTTPWYDLERLYRICTRQEPHPSVIRSPLTRELSSIPDLQKRIQKTMELVGKKGSLRAELLRQVRHSSRKKREYVESAIQNLHDELGAIDTSQVRTVN